jgi:localization factor PodJL
MAHGVPWNMRGMDPALRDAAILSAHRAGMSVEQWMSAVLSGAQGYGAPAPQPFPFAPAYGQQPAVAPPAAPYFAPYLTTPQFPQPNPLDAVAERISRLGQNGHISPLRETTAPADEARVAQIIDKAVSALEENTRQSEHKTASALDAVTRLIERATMETEARAAKTVETAVNSLEQATRQREEKTNAALETITQLVERATASAQEARTAKRDPFAESPALRETLGKITHRIEALDRRIETESASAVNPVRDMIGRIENRLDSLSSQAHNPVVASSLRDLDARLQDIARKLEQPEPYQSRPNLRDDNISRIEGKLATILDALNQQVITDPAGAAARLDAMPEHGWSAPQTRGSNPLSRRPLVERDVQGAVETIAARQRHLDDLAPARPKPQVATPAPAPTLSTSESAALEEIRHRLKSLSDQIVAPTANASDDRLEALRREIATISSAIENVAPRHLVVSIETAVRDLAGRVEQSRDVGMRAHHLAPVEKLLTDLRVAVESLRDTGAIDVLRRDLKTLSDGIAASGMRSADSTMIAALHAQMTEIRDLVGRAREPIALEGLEHRINNLSQKLERIAATPADTTANATLVRAVEDVRATLHNALPTELLARIEKRIGDLGGIEKRLNELTNRFDGMAGRADFAMLNERIDWLQSAIAAHTANLGVSPELSSIQKTLAAVSEKLDTAQRQDDRQSMNGLEAQVQRIAQRIEELDGGRAGFDALHERMDRMQSSLAGKSGALPATHDLSSIEAALKTLVARIDNAERDGDDKSLAALEAQIAKISEKLERQDGGLASIGSLDRSIGDLFSQLEDVRTAAGNAALPAVDAIARDLNQLRDAQSDSDRRTQETLGAVHDTLARIADRLGQMEAQGAPAPAAPAPAPAPTVQKTGGSALKSALSQAATSFTTRSATRELPAERVPTAVPAKSASRPLTATRAQTDTPLPRVDGSLALDMPIEPGTGRPGSTTARPAMTIGADAAQPDNKANFIAAARRAAQAAADQSAEALKSHREAASPNAANGSSLKSFVTTRKKPILIGLLAAFVGLVAVQQASTLLKGTAANPPPPGEPKLSSGGAGTDTGPRPEASNAPAEKAPTPKDKVSRIIDGTSSSADPQTVGSVDKMASANPSSGANEAKPSSPARIPGAVPETAPTQAIPGTTAPQQPLAPAQLAELTPLAAPVTSERLRSAALAGDPLALHEIAVRYVEGKGVPRDPAIAAKFLAAASKLGLAPAQYRLASLYREGRGVKADKQEAFGLFKQAGEQGHARAMHNVGVLLAEGVTGAPDYTAAAEWFIKASELNVKDSQYNLAILYARGLGVTQDLGASYKWFNAAAQQGDEDAKKKRDEVAARIPADKIAEVKSASEQWRPLLLDSRVNDVAVPPGGWDAPVKAPAKGKPARV